MGSKFDELLELAADQHGLVQARNAAAHGIDPAYLRRWALAGRLDRVGHGLYRVPALAGSLHEEYLQAVLWAGGRGVISHSSALALHELANVNPSRMHITVPTTYVPRRAGGTLYRLWRRNLDPADITTVDDVPVVTAYRAIIDAAHSGEDPEMVKQALRTARSRHDLTPAQVARVRRILDRSTNSARTTKNPMVSAPDPRVGP